MASGNGAEGTGCGLDMIKIVGSDNRGKSANEEQYEEHTSSHCGNWEL